MGLRRPTEQRAISGEAVQELQHTAEDMIFELFEEAYRAAIRVKSVTLRLKSIELDTCMLHGTVNF